MTEKRNGNKNIQIIIHPQPKKNRDLKHSSCSIKEL